MWREQGCGGAGGEEVAGVGREERCYREGRGRGSQADPLGEPCIHPLRS